MSKESNHQFIHQLMSSLKRIQDHINEPEVIQSILDTIMPRDEELASILDSEDDGPIDNSDKDDPVIDYDPKTGEPFVTTAGEAGLDNESMSALRKKFSTQEEDHFGEEQAEGLDNLLEGLRDTPHDNRW